MFDYITIPIWLFLILFAVALWAILDRVLIPSTRWFLRRRINRVIDEISTRLDIQIRPFQITKRQVLIDRLVYDPKVIEAVQQEAVKRECPREIVQSEVIAYAKEIVPSFNAYLYFRFGYWLSKRIAKLLYWVHIGFKEVAKLADELMAGIKKVILILPISLVSTIIKEDGRQGLSAAEVESQTKRLIETFRLQGAPLCFTAVGRVEIVINYE